MIAQPGLDAPPPEDKRPVVLVFELGRSVDAAVHPDMTVADDLSRLGA